MTRDASDARNALSHFACPRLSIHFFHRTSEGCIYCNVGRLEQWSEGGFDSSPSEPCCRGRNTSEFALNVMMSDGMKDFLRHNEGTESDEHSSNVMEFFIEFNGLSV